MRTHVYAALIATVAAGPTPTPAECLTKTFTDTKDICTWDICKTSDTEKKWDFNCKKKFPLAKFESLKEVGECIYGKAEPKSSTTPTLATC